MKSEAAESLLEALKERLSSIFFFNMIISFIYVKWQFVYFTIFDSYLNYKPGEYISLAKSYFYCNGTIADILIVAIGITLTFPLINGLYNSFKYLINKGVDWIQIKIIDKNTPASGKEFAQLKLELKDIKNQYHNLFSEETRNLERLKLVEQDLNFKNEECKKLYEEKSLIEINLNQVNRDLIILKNKNDELEKSIQIPDNFLGRIIIIFDTSLFSELMKYKEVDIFDFFRKKQSKSNLNNNFENNFFMISFNKTEIILGTQHLKIKYITYKDSRLFIFSSNDILRFWIEFENSTYDKNNKIYYIRISYINGFDNNIDLMKKFNYAYVSNQKS